MDFTSLQGWVQSPPQSCLGTQSSEPGASLVIQGAPDLLILPDQLTCVWKRLKGAGEFWGCGQELGNLEEHRGEANPAQSSGSDS